MTSVVLPRVVVAGLSGDGGKTFVSLGLIRGLLSLGKKVAAYKKGPDYIDAAWLGKAAGSVGRNLDSFLMSPAVVRRSMGESAQAADVALIEGNRGLFDGFDEQGSHSTAQLATITQSPVLLVIDATKTTRTVAALVLGCLTMDPDLNIAGVILNRVGTLRQERLIRKALAACCDVEVLGAVPRDAEVVLPSRHLGLVTASEHEHSQQTLDKVAALISDNVDLQAVLRLAQTADPLTFDSQERLSSSVVANMAVFCDRAFSFYYPENLAALESSGARLSYVSPLEDEQLPDVDGLYIGGGFPEEYASSLSANQPFRSSCQKAIAQGLPAWAECGGLMYLARRLRTTDGQSHDMVGALDIEVEQKTRPQGHGYVKANVDGENPFLDQGQSIVGHEFHYSRLVPSTTTHKTVLALARGVGVGGSRDGIRSENLVACYTHLHALSAPEWAQGMVRAAAGDVH